jgi:hypothetical protein
MRILNRTLFRSRRLFDPFPSTFSFFRLLLPDTRKLAAGENHSIVSQQRNPEH